MADVLRMLLGGKETREPSSKRLALATLMWWFQWRSGDAGMQLSMEDDLAAMVSVFPRWREWFLDGDDDTSLRRKLEEIARSQADVIPRLFEVCGIGQCRLTEQGRQSVERDASTYGWLFELETVMGEQPEGDISTPSHMAA
jgi:hypothetical protein